jgi:transcriptional regulator NrdR family protein
MVKVKKRVGEIEEYMESKIIAGCKNAGATTEEAVKVAKEVSMKAGKTTVVDAEKLSDMVVESLRKVNKAAADGFHKFRTEKYEKKP